MQLLEVSAKAKGRSHAWEAAVIMHSSGGKITEAWIQVRDQFALDEFLNGLAEA